MTAPPRRPAAPPALAALLLALLLVPACGGKKEAPPGKEGAAAPKAAAPVDVAVEKARREAVARRADFVGSLAGVEQAVVSAEIDGTVSKVSADLGDAVTKGQTLVTVSPDEFRYRRDQAVSEAEQAAARLGIPPSADTADVEKTSLVQRALADQRNARTDFERKRGLADRNLIARKEADDAEARLAVADANVKAAREEANTQLAALRGKRAAAALAEKKVGDTSVRAPIPGAVEARLVNAGEYVKVGTPLYRLVNDRPVKLVGDVPEGYANLLRRGQAVELSVEGHPGKVFRGTLSRVAPSSDAANRSIRVEALFPNADRALKPGFFGKGSVLLSVDAAAVTVPKAALVTFAGIDKVFVVKDGKAQERKVVVGQDLGDRIEISSGVTAGEDVAVSGTGKLYADAPVGVVATPPPAAAGGATPPPSPGKGEAR